MLYTVPDYYEQFQCIAGKCEDSCCAGWEIVIDPKTLQKYRAVKGGFGNCLHNSIQFHQSCFKQYEGRCAFLNDQNLCEIYSELGPELLCETCKKYPRHEEEYEGVRDLSLALSCPEVARILLGHKERVRFIEKENHKEVDEEDFDEFNFLLYTKLVDARSCMIGTMQNRMLPVHVRAAICFAFSHDLQNRIKKQEYDTMDRLINRYKSERIVAYLVNKLNAYKGQDKERFAVIKKQMGLLFHLEVLREDWKDWIKDAYRELYGNGLTAYVRKRKKFLSYMEKNKELNNAFEIQWEQLYIYFLYTYFCGAVYDENVYSKMKLAIMSPIYIQELCQARWQMRGKVTFADIVEIAHHYAREVEHSDSNLKKMERAFQKKREYYFEKMITVLLS
ncbi:flagellin lysine-N-methylase [Anaerosporobacter faecicola]|uniref:flagellin lysine-N-methylase n=1 Tax=Anaerosporobacter faecicola TaxID=2718714 RepID=UPI00143B3843|nr:flagellin lysine-N-methylase [Anaerosporobacter faecicola]